MPEDDAVRLTAAVGAQMFGGIACIESLPCEIEIRQTEQRYFDALAHVDDPTPAIRAFDALTASAPAATRRAAMRIPSLGSTSSTRTVGSSPGMLRRVLDRLRRALDLARLFDPPDWHPDRMIAAQIVLYVALRIVIATMWRVPSR